MSNIASVVNGEISQSTTTTTSSSSSDSSLDKEAFLNLLVTQMKYQDPLEPTDNTEYVSQLATFSSLEEMQNMSSTMTISRASSLVGEYVTVNVTDDNTGVSTLVGGKVDYVAIENNKAYLNINGTNYSIDDLDSVVDSDYLDAYNLASQFATSLNTLPTVGNLTTAYKETIESLRETYDSMTDYQKQFISSTQLDSLEEYEERLSELLLTG